MRPARGFTGCRANWRGSGGCLQGIGMEIAGPQLLLSDSDDLRNRVPIF
jgi:hypothetical protein